MSRRRVHLEVLVSVGVLQERRSTGLWDTSRTVDLEASFHVFHRGRHLAPSAPIQRDEPPRELDLVDRGRAAATIEATLDPDAQATDVARDLVLRTCDRDRSLAIRLEAPSLPAQDWLVVTTPDDARARVPGPVTMRRLRSLGRDWGCIGVGPTAP